MVLSLRQETTIRFSSTRTAVVGVEALVGVLNHIHYVLAVPSLSLVSHGVRIAQVEGSSVAYKTVHALLIKLSLVNLVIRSKVCGFIGRVTLRVSPRILLSGQWDVAVLQFDILILLIGVPKVT